MQETGSNDKKISVHVSLNGISYETDSCARSEWLGAGCLKTLPQLQTDFNEAQISLFTPLFTLVPTAFYSEHDAFGILSNVVTLDEGAGVESLALPQYDAVALYSVGDMLRNSLAQVVDGLRLSEAATVKILPEAFRMLELLPGLEGFNKIIASYDNWHLYLAIAQGDALSLCTVYEAADFVTAEYYIFLAMKSLQLNPQVSVINFRTKLAEVQELSLSNYFKAVNQL